jgi:hypothetical protein
MSVNSRFKKVFYNRWTMLFAIGLGMLTILLLTSSFTKHSARDLHAKQVNLLIRQIGHRLLLQAGDSTSRVMPVMEVKEGTFLLRFEKELVFNHDSLVALTQDLLPKAQFPSGYTVTVHDCKGADIVYGFQVNNTLPDILPCNGRRQPVGCYSVEFAFPDFYESVGQNEATPEQLTQRALLLKADRQETESKNERKFSEKNDEHDINRLTEQLKSFKDGLHKAGPISTATGAEKSKTTTTDYPLSNLIYSGLLVLLAGTLLIARYGKIFTNSTSRDRHEEIIKQPVPELPAIGKFLFDVKNQRLLLGSALISLTDKECRILELLNKSFGDLISRETLMQEIWINEGVITGRSLDMFVSKLRKKLSGDPELRITNVHGKGYKLEISGIQIL